MARRRKIYKNDLTARRRKRAKFRTYIVGFSAILALAGFVFLIRLPALRIQNIIVSGNKDVSADEIKKVVEPQISGNYLFFIPKDNLFIYPKGQIALNIKKEFPRVSYVRLGSGLDGNLSVEIGEKTAVALWCGSKCYLLDSSGDVFAQAASASLSEQDFVHYTGSIDGDPINKNYTEYQSFSELVKNLSDLGLTAIGIKLIDENSGETTLSDGTVIKFLPSEATSTTLTNNLKIFLDNLKAKNGGTMPNFEYIDARYDNKIFYKLRN